MVNIYTGSNTMAPIGRVEDFNNTNPSHAVAVYRTLSASTGMSGTESFTSNSPKTDFAQAVYGDGPYSLLRPNSVSDTLAKNIDIIA